jgi:hypothetical protein
MNVIVTARIQTPPIVAVSTTRELLAGVLSSYVTGLDVAEDAVEDMSTE